VWVHLPDGTAVQVWAQIGDDLIPCAQVDRWVDPQTVDGVLIGEATFQIPDALPLGWHQLIVKREVDPEAISTVLVVTPDRVDLPARSSDEPGWGFASQVYSVRSRDSYGLGDIADLGAVAAWSGSLGADFLLVNPMHAASPQPPMAPSPYLPVTRRFANPIYIRPEDIEEFAGLTPVQLATVQPGIDRCRQANCTADLLERDPVWAVKREVLELVREVARTEARQAELSEFIAREGPGLTDFALWCALADTYGDPRDWPAEIADVTSAAVAQARVSLADLVDFHIWCQWILDEQFAAAQARAVASGMALGIVHDLAVGVHPDGSDAWALRSVLAGDIEVGAPPDMYNQVGQNWSQPPWRPDALAEAAYVPFRDMLRTILRHAGGIRVDHVLGLFRLWWIPKGAPANKGTYVRYDHEALLGILALEATLAQAVVVGEDLGTLEPWVQEALRERGFLGTTVLWFETEPDGRPRDPAHWRELSLASVTVHDLPPSAGYLAGEHVRLRHELGLLAQPFDQEWAEYERSREVWISALIETGLLTEPYTIDDIVVALHAFAARSPAALFAVALVDAVGDRRAQNQPGTDQEYPNWRVPLCDGEGNAVLVEDLPTLKLPVRIIRAINGG
jgi:4-alpha-glucanotransferase